MTGWLTIFDMIGTVAFSVSGALTGIRKHMDIFGVTILGLSTATAGGIIRDVILGITLRQHVFQFHLFIQTEQPLVKRFRYGLR